MGEAGLPALALFVAGLYRREEDDITPAVVTRAPTITREKPFAIDGSRTLIEAARAKMAS